jgi:arylsulfatase A-like enzyme
MSNHKSLFFALSLFWGALAHASEQPHVIFVMADDIGVGDIAMLNREALGKDPVIKTPVLDDMIRQGMLFTRAHSSTSLCSPTRYSTLTGNYTARSDSDYGIWGSYNKPAIDKKTKTIGNIMQEAGYRTGFIGKWHIGSDWLQEDSQELYTEDIYGIQGRPDGQRIIDGGPSTRGFDYSICLPSGIQNVPYAVYENSHWLPLKQNSILKKLTWRDVPKGTQLGKKAGLGDSNWDASIIGELITDKAIDFIDDSLSSEKPFFLTYFTQAVHHPHNPPETFKGQAVRGTQGNGTAPHLDMIFELDCQMGSLIQHLKKKGIYENTLFIFTSDNGGMGETNYVPQTLASGHDSTAGLRGDKSHIHEGGHRVPFIVIWPGKISPNSRNSAPVITHDIAATLYELTNRDIPKDQAKDSKSFLKALKQDQNYSQREDYLISGSRENMSFAYYHGDHKLILKGSPHRRPNYGKAWRTRENTIKSYQDDRPKSFIVTGLFNLKNNQMEDESKNLVNHPEFFHLKDKLLHRFIEHKNENRTTTTSH